MANRLRGFLVSGPLDLAWWKRAKYPQALRQCQQRLGPGRPRAPASNTHAAIGSRREPTSDVVKQGRRNARGKLFINLWRQLLPALGNIVDTQCGFKAFRADAARALTEDSLEREFAFDTELLLRTELDSPVSAAELGDGIRL